MQKDFHSIGIILTYGYGGSNGYGWSATIKFENGIMQLDTIVGEISTKYFNPSLSDTIDNILKIKENFNIKFFDEIEDIEIKLKRTIYYLEDGESEEFPPPFNWKEKIKEECEKRDFEYIYD